MQKVHKKPTLRARLNHEDIQKKDPLSASREQPIPIVSYDMEWSSIHRNAHKQQLT
jgi:hypothetical protein